MAEAVGRVLLTVPRGGDRAALFERVFPAVLELDRAVRATVPRDLSEATGQGDGHGGRQAG
jgi:hypothetical protein